MRDHRWIFDDVSDSTKSLDQKCPGQSLADLACLHALAQLVHYVVCRIELTWHSPHSQPLYTLLTAAYPRLTTYLLNPPVTIRPRRDSKKDYALRAGNLH